MFGLFAHPVQVVRAGLLVAIAVWSAGAASAASLRTEPDQHLLDTFDAHVWLANRDDGTFLPELDYAPQHATQGTDALSLTTRVVADPAELFENHARFDVLLAEPEDWRDFSFVTLDIYMEEFPTGLAEARLHLANSKGEIADTPLILGWQLFQWENHQMTFPLQGNTYRFDAIPPEILSDVAAVGLAVTRFSDAGYGTAYQELNVHFDNIRLGGSELWDSFDRPRWRWYDDTGRSPITHNQRAHHSAGSLRVAGRTFGMPAVAEAATTHSALKALGFGPAASIPEVVVTTASASFALAPAVSSAPDTEGWVELSWPLPQDVAETDIRRIQFTAPPDAPYYLDDLALGTPPATGVSVRAPGHAGAREAIPVLCLDTGQACSSGKAGDSDGDAAAIVYRPNGFDYELAFDAENGALVHVRHRATGAELSTGSFAGSLWALTFLDEVIQPKLRGAEFSRDDPRRRFWVSQNPFSLNYSYTGITGTAEIRVELTPVDARRLDFRVHLRNRTTAAVRTVTFPEKLAFQQDAISEVLYPIQEGLVLLPPFFAAERAVVMNRPPMFADILAYDGPRGGLSLHMIQDSSYHAEKLPDHPHGAPVFQPNVLGTGGSQGQGWFTFDMVTYVPPGQDWRSATLRMTLDQHFPELAVQYRRDNGIDRFPSLRHKLGTLFDATARSTVLHAELFKTVAWQKADEANTWRTIREEWLDRLPSPAILHLTRWQKGRDWYDDPYQNHKLEDDHPEALPIWWDRYGREEEFDLLLKAARDKGFMTMPFTNWTVWNTTDPDTKDIPPLAETPAAATTTRGLGNPHLEYKGYMIKPWSPEVRARNDRMFATYTTTYPQDMMFVDMTGERSWRYVGTEDGSVSVAAYTQGVIDENRRLSTRKPLFTEGVFDRIGDSITGYAQTLRQKFWNDILAVIGTEYEDWAAYPFAAMVLHDKSAFYQHDLNTEVWPAENAALASYYALTGYNYMVDLTSHIGESEDMIWALDAIQKSVNVRTFGQPLLAYHTLRRDRSLRRTIWGPANNPVTVLAHADPAGTGRAYPFGGHDIAPDGFLATSADGAMTAGIFAGRFNNRMLAPGLHWITLLQEDGRIILRHPLGRATDIAVPYLPGWQAVEKLRLAFAMPDGTYVLAADTYLQAGLDAITVQFPKHIAGLKPRYAVIFSGPFPFSDARVRPAPETEWTNVWSLTAAAAVDCDSQAADIEVLPSAIRLTPTGDGQARLATPAIALDSEVAQFLRLEVRGLSAGSRVVVQLQQDFGDYRADEIAIISDAGQYQVPLNGVMDPGKTRPYKVLFWLEGEPSPIMLATLAVESSDAFAPEDFSVWQYQLTDVPQNWTSDNTSLTSANGILSARLDDTATGGGKLESSLLFLNDEVTRLNVEVAAIAPETGVTLALQQQFPPYAKIDLVRDLTVAGAQSIDLSPHVGHIERRPYRVVFWVSGSGSVRLGSLALARTDGYSIALATK